MHAGPSAFISLEVVEVSSIPGIYTFEMEGGEKSKAGPAVVAARRKVESAVEYCLAQASKILHH